jgi:hypothetical protein
MNHKLTTSAVTAGILGVALAGLLIAWWDSYAVLSAAMGVAAGWALGILLAPYETEEKKFAGWSKGLFGFLGGVTFTKIEAAFGRLTGENSQLLLSITVLRRVAVGFTCLLVTAIVVFVFRTYYQIDEE